MEIFLFSRPRAEYVAGELQRLVQQMEEHLPGYRVNRDFAARLACEGIAQLPAERIYERMEPCGESGVAISYGGDGTFLDCVRLAGPASLPVLGINSGRLGFLANVPLEGMEQALEDIAAGHFSTETRSLIKVSGDFQERPGYPFAFNEFSLQRGGAEMISVETYVDGQMVATYWGDGVLLSTPSGSTAYSLSAGGPVLVPGCDCFVISPIAPHNLTMRPVVIPNNSRVEMKVRTRGANPYATIDNLTFPVGGEAQFTMEKGEKSIFLVRLQNISFYDTLRNKMMWGVDHRSTRH